MTALSQSFDPVFGSWYTQSQLGSGTDGKAFTIVREDETGKKQRAVLKTIRVGDYRNEKKSFNTIGDQPQKPTKEEILICMRFLWREIETVQPSVIVTLGNTPLQALLEDPKATIGTLHGQEIPGQHGDARYILFPLYHPASLIYNRSLAPVYRQDLEKLRRFLTLQDIFPD